MKSSTKEGKLVFMPPITMPELSFKSNKMKKNSYEIMKKPQIPKGHRKYPTHRRPSRHISLGTIDLKTNYNIITSSSKELNAMERNRDILGKISDKTQKFTWLKKSISKLADKNKGGSLRL